MASPHHQLRALQSGDLPKLLSLYARAVRSQCPALYSPAQVEAWARHAHQSELVSQTICRGFTLVNPVQPGQGELAAFGVLEPLQRLALLYCDGRFSRQGRAGALLEALENHAQGCGAGQLRTEASQLSRPLLLRHGWQIEAEETVLFAGERFTRWRMIKPLPS